MKTCTFIFFILDPINHKNNWTRLKEGHQDALLVIFNAFYVGLINYGIKITGDRDLTRDCITQVLLRLWEKREDIPDVDNVRAYLAMCLHNELISQKRDSHAQISHHKKIGMEWPAATGSYEDHLISSQQDRALREKIKKGMEALSPRQKELIQLKYFDDLTYDEIALRCRITKRTAYNIIQKALIILKMKLRQPPK